MMIKKEYKINGEHIIFEFPDELLSKYERWIELNTDATMNTWDEWYAIDEELLPYKNDLNP